MYRMHGEYRFYVIMLLCSMVVIKIIKSYFSIIVLIQKYSRVKIFILFNGHVATYLIVDYHAKCYQ